MKSFRIILYLCVAVIATSCKPEIDTFTPSAGSADFTKYISIGNSLTAGYTDGDLYRTGQVNSYPNIMSQQMALVGGGEFKQPLMYDELGFGGRRILAVNMPKDCSGEVIPGGTPSLGPVLMGGTIDQLNYTVISNLGPYNNLGVPGAKSFHLLLPFYGNFNNYFKRFADDPTNTSILAQAAQMNATFFSLWIGNNDVLTYALTGGEADSVTSINTFTYAFSTVIETLTANGAKGVVATIPDITTTPYFTTFPYNALALTSEEQVAGLNQAYAPLGISFNIGQNALIIADATAPGGLRQIKPNELVLLSLPQDSIRCAGWGSLKPVPANFVLDEAEISLIQNAIMQYNEVITSTAQAKDLALVNANAFMKNALSGIAFDGIQFNTSFVTGGLFSLDGIHLSARGNAITANNFIEAINNKYNATIPLVNVGDYQGIRFP